MKIYIYLLIENGVPFYIGKTNNLYKRLNHHKWRLNNYFIEIEELELVNENNWKFWECYWIEQFTSWGFILLNKNKGGGGLLKHKLESIENSRKKRKGQKRITTSLKLKGIPRSEKTKDKISKSNKNKNKPQGFELVRSKPIIQMDLEGNFIKEWINQSIASKELGISQTLLNNVLNKRKYYITAKGFKWKYK